MPGRTLMMRLAVALAAAAAVAGCSSAVGSVPSASGSAAAQPTSYAPAVQSACTLLASEIDDGQLVAAERTLAGDTLKDANPTCAIEATALVADRRTQAAALVESARATPAQARLLVAAALRLDADNAQARAIAAAAGLRRAPSTPPGAAPTLTFAPRPAATPTAHDACEPVREALSEGRLTEASQIADALDAKADCAAEVTSSIAAKRAGQPLVRSWRSLADDRLPELLLVAALLVLGGLVARAVTARGRRRVWGGFWPAVVSGALLAVGLVAPAVAQLFPAFVEWLPGGWAGFLWDAVTAVLALVFGGTLVMHLRAMAPTMVEVVDTTGKSVDSSTFGTLVVSEVRTIAEAPPRGVFAVTGGTDLADSGVAAALDTISQTYLKAAITVWRALTTGLGDRVRISLVGTDTDPVATVLLRRGSRTVYEERVDTRELRVDKSAPSEDERATVTQDLATAVAARLVLASIGVVGTDRVDAAPQRLYGVTEPRSLAAAAVAARHSARSRYAEATELFARAYGLDPKNLAARYGRDVNALRQSAAGADALVALTDLERLAATLWESGNSPASQQSPLAWRCRYTVAVHRVNRILTGGLPRPGTHARSLLVGHRAVLETLGKELEALPLVESGRGDARLADRLGRLATCAAAGLRAIDATPAVEVRDALRALLGDASVRATVNIANGYALLWKRRPNGGARRDLVEAIDLIRLAGLEVGMRADILADPVLALLRTTAPHRAVVRGWGLEPAVPYAALACIGAQAATTLGRSYPTTRGLQRALVRNPGEVLGDVDVDASSLAWWLGALDWLLAGRDAAAVNAYQAAGIRDAAQAKALGDAAVVAALHRRRKDDHDVVVPDGRVRALMAS